MTLNVLLSLIIQSKVTGKGITGNGKLYVKFMKIMADNESTELSADKNILNKFNNEVVEKEAYHKLDRFLSRFLKDGNGYPYKIIYFNEFESNIGNTFKFHDYLRKMELACGEIIDYTKLDSLIYTLLEILRQDKSIKKILYGSEYISKDKLFGSYAHPKRICVEALIMGLLYQTHKKSAKSENIELLNAPDRLKFHVVRFSDENSLDLEMPIELIENIHENAKRQKPAEMKYNLELHNRNKAITEIPDNENVFLYGVGGAGKSTLLLNQICNENTINFYLPLYQYKKEIHENLQPESCWIWLNILLKYHYQYEYSTYETLIANEEENAILQQFSRLDKQLKDNLNNWRPRYVLLLDGLNEMSSELQKDFAVELSHIVNEWKNIRIIVTGRIVPKYDVFRDFYKIEVCGITDSERDAVLYDFSDISGNKSLMDILKIPMFLNMYLESNSDELNTRVEILDFYIMNWKSKSSEIFETGNENDTIQFIVQYILPCAAKNMLDKYNSFKYIERSKISYEITRGDLLKVIDKTFEIYILDEYVYQSYIAPKGFRKKILLQSREKVDFIELILDNIGLMRVSENDFTNLHFVHQYFRDYFAAKHILNLLEIVDTSYKESSVEEQKEAFKGFGLDNIWFFYDEMEIYRLLGEICGDYKNIHNGSDSIFWYKTTIMDRLLDMYRKFGEKEDGFHITENVINVMNASRNGVICNVDFNRVPLPFNIPCNIKFSQNGAYPCSFRNSIVDCIGICENTKKFIESRTWENFAVISSDKRLILIILYDNYILLWDNKTDKILWDIDLSEYAEYNSAFEYADFSADGKKIELLTSGCLDKCKVTVDSYSGKIMGYEYEEFFEYNFMNEKFLMKGLKLKIFQQLQHFKNCDFQGAKFIYEDYSEILCDMGALTDKKPQSATQENINSPYKSECTYMDEIKSELKFIDESFSQMLMRKIAESGMSDSECCKKAHVDCKIFSEICNNANYKPLKTTLVAFAIALELPINETKELLAKAGYSLTYSSKFDIIIEYFIRDGRYNIIDINEVLLEFGETLLY